MASARYSEHFIEQPAAKLSPQTIASLADALGLPGKLFAEISHGESGYHPGVVQHDPGDGNVGYGLVQNTPHAWGAAGKAYLAKLGGVGELRDPVKNLLMARFLYKSAGNSIKPWYGTKYVTSREGEGKLGPADVDKAYAILQGAGGRSQGSSADASALMGGTDQPQPQAQGSSEGLNAGVAALLAAGQQQKPVIQSAGIAAPAFSARAALPQGAQLPQGGGGPVAPQGANVDQLLSLAAAQGQQAAPAPAAVSAPESGGASSGDVQTQLARAAAIDAKRLPYKWGGGHGGRVDPSKPVPLDCSGAVSAVLGIDPRVASQFKGFGSPGDSGDKGTTIYAKDSHVLMKIDGHFFGTSQTNPGGGAGWIPRSAISPEYLKGFTARHVGG